AKTGSPSTRLASDRKNAAMALASSGGSMAVVFVVSVACVRVRLGRDIREVLLCQRLELIIGATVAILLLERIHRGHDVCRLSDARGFRDHRSEHGWEAAIDEVFAQAALHL